jgi:DUF2934 family protein
MNGGPELFPRSVLICTSNLGIGRYHVGEGQLQMAKPAGEMQRIESSDGNNKLRSANHSRLENDSAVAIDAAENEGLPVSGEPRPFTTIPAAELDSFIQARAYEIYEKNCRADGHAHRHWRQAQSEILGCR